MAISFDATYDKENHSFQIPADIQGAALYRLFGLFVVAMEIARQPGLIAQLKGAAISAWLALAVRADKNTLSCFPAVATIGKDAGYGQVTARNGLVRLDEAGLITRTQHQRRPTNYVLQTSTKATDFVDLADPASPEKHQNGARIAKNEAKSPQTTESVGEHKDVVVVTPSKTVEQQHVRLQKMKPKNEEWQAVQEKLVKEGISESIAHKLLQDVQENGREVRYVKAWILAYKEGRRNLKYQGVGFLIAMLRRNVDVAKEYELKAMTDRERRLRYVQGPYAHLIDN